MSKPVLSIMDHKMAENDDMQYLTQPRGPGKSWVFRRVTPPDLIGLPNPWDGKPLRKEIKKGRKRRLDLTSVQLDGFKFQGRSSSIRL